MPNKHYNLSLIDFFKTYVFKKKCPLCKKTLKGMKREYLAKHGYFSVSGTHYYGDMYDVKFYLNCSNCNKNFEIPEIECKK